MAGEANKGWISLYRSIQDHWLWQEKPFSKAQAWLDLLLSANHQDKKIVFDSNLVEVKRGEFITSIRKLCERWGWSNSKVTKFLETLQLDGMITYKSDTKKTTINIVNYNVYQPSSDAENVTETSQKHHRSITETSQKHTNNNDNNDNNIYDDDIYREVNIKLQQAYFNTFKVLPSITQLDILTFFLKKSDQIPEPLDIDTVIYALERTAVWNGSNVAYTEKILWTWYEKGVRTKEQAEMLVKEREIQIAEKRKQQQQHQPKKQYKSKYERDMDSLKRAYDKAIQDEKGGNEFDIF